MSCDRELASGPAHGGEGDGLPELARKLEKAQCIVRPDQHNSIWLMR